MSISMRKLTRLEALKIKLRQLEDEALVYAAVDCPLCVDVCHLLRTDTVMCLNCDEYANSEIGWSPLSTKERFAYLWIYEFKRRFWISHCLREIKTELLKEVW